MINVNVWMPIMLDKSPAMKGKSAVYNSEGLDPVNVSATVPTSSKATAGRSILVDDISFRRIAYENQ